MIEFRRNPYTGEVTAYRDGVPIGPVLTMGDPEESPRGPRPEEGDAHAR